MASESDKQSGYEQFLQLRMTKELTPLQALTADVSIMAEGFGEALHPCIRPTLQEAFDLAFVFILQDRAGGINQHAARRQLRLERVHALGVLLDDLVDLLVLDAHCLEHLSRECQQNLPCFGMGGFPPIASAGPAPQYLAARVSIQTE